MEALVNNPVVKVAVAVYNAKEAVVSGLRSAKNQAVKGGKLVLEKGSAVVTAVKNNPKLAAGAAVASAVAGLAIAGAVYSAELKNAAVETLRNNLDASQGVGQFINANVLTFKAEEAGGVMDTIKGFLGL